MSESSDLQANSQNFESDTQNFTEISHLSSTSIYSENIFSDLQNDIFEQGRQIESFIKMHAKHKSASESFKVLQKLFTLFKSVIAITFNLRKLILDYRYQLNNEPNKFGSMNNETRTFLKQASLYCSQPCRNLSEVLVFLKSNQKNRIKKSNLQKENEKLVIHIQELQNKLIDYDAQQGLEHVELRNQQEQLQSLLSQQNLELQLIKAENAQLKATFTMNEQEQTKTIKHYQKQIDDEAKNNAQKLNRANENLLEMKKEHEKLLIVMNRLKSENDKLTDSVKQKERDNQELLFTINQEKQKQKEMTNSIIQIQEKLSIFEEKAKRPNERFHGKRHKKYHTIIKKLTKENKTLKHTNTNFSKNIDDLNMEIDRLKDAIRMNNDTYFSSESHAGKICQAYHYLCEKLNISYKDDPEKVVSSVIKELQMPEMVTLCDQTMLHKDEDLSYHQEIESNSFEAPLQEQIKLLKDEIESLQIDLEKH